MSLLSRWRARAREVRTRRGDLAALAAEVGNPEVGLAKELGFGVLSRSHRQLQVIDLTPARLESPRSLGLPHGRSQLQLALRFVRKAARAAEEADRLAVGEALECVIPRHHQVLRGAGVVAGLLEVQRA